MNKETGRQVWIAPKLEQIAMVDTAAKGASNNESNDPNLMIMAGTGGNS